MLEGTVNVVNQLGLHARAAAKLVRLAAGFSSRILVIRSDRNVEANAKSILSVLTLAASIGTKLTIKVDGADEELAFEAIRDIFESGFGESNNNGQVN